MANVIKIRETEAFEQSNQKKKQRRERRKRRAIRQTKQALNGKVFADLTVEEKDDLLKALAISSGILKE